MFIDSHAHLDDIRLFNKLDAVLNEAQENKIEKIVTIGTCLETSLKNLEIAQKYEQVYAAVGIHPHEAKDITKESDYQKLIILAKKEKVVAIGEIGLDYHYDHSPREKQKEVFQKQLKIAKEIDKPVIIHDREAHADILAFLKKQAKGLSGVLHCFSGSLEMAREVIKMGFYISIAGPITFNNAKKLQSIVSEIPLEKILIETDCPYLAPHPKRGICNQPSYVIYVAEKIAEIKQIKIEKVGEVTTENAKNLFRINGN